MARLFTKGSNTTYLWKPDGGSLDITGTALTIAFWLNMDGSAQEYSSVIMKGGAIDHTSATTTCQYGIYVAGYNYLYGFIGDAAGQDGGTIISLNSLKNAGWKHIAMVKRPGMLDYYIDGGLVKQIASAKSIQNTTSPFYIAHAPGGEGSFGGGIGHVAIWNASLDANEIGSLRRGPVAAPRRGNLAAYFPMWNGGLVTTEPDWSGNGQNLTEASTVLDSGPNPPVGPMAVAA